MALESGLEERKAMTDFGWIDVTGLAGLAVSYLLTGDTRYHQTVVSQMDYLLGKNAVGYSYVTGYGTRAFSHPHNRPTIAAGVKTVMPGWECYSLNEITIYWNSPLVFLAAYLQQQNQ